MNDLLDDLREMEAEIRKMGYPHAEVRLTVNAYFNNNYGVSIEYGLSSASRDTKNSYHYGSTVSDAMGKASDTIAKIPSVRDTRRAEMLEAVARAIELGREIGEDVSVNMLQELMVKLAERAITHG